MSPAVVPGVGALWVPCCPLSNGETKSITFLLVDNGAERQGFEVGICHHGPSVEFEQSFVDVMLPKRVGRNEKLAVVEWKKLAKVVNGTLRPQAAHLPAGGDGQDHCSILSASR